MIGKVANKDTILLEMAEKVLRYFETDLAAHRPWFSKKKVGGALVGFPVAGAKVIQRIFASRFDFFRCISEVRLVSN